MTHEFDPRTGAPLLWKQVGKLGDVHSGKEKVPERS